jgi:hypothetical protein
MVGRTATGLYNSILSFSASDKTTLVLCVFLVDFFCQSPGSLDEEGDKKMPSFIKQRWDVLHMFGLTYPAQVREKVKLI